MTVLLGRRAALAASAGAAVIGRRARAGEPVRIGVLTEMSGTYAEDSGAGSVVAARMAIDDFDRERPGALAVELVSGDAQTKPDVASALARSWFDQGGVDAIFDVPVSNCAMAVAAVTRAHDKVAVFNTSTSELTGKACSPNHIQWAYDTYALAGSTARALLKDGGDTWFMIQADYTFGATLATEATAVIQAGGGRVLGTVKHPFPGTVDFAGYLLAAQASGAKVIGLANAGTDAANCVKQAGEFGLTRGGAKLATLQCLLPQLHGVGIEAAQGLYNTESFYWDLNPGTRAFSARWAPLNGGNKPSMIHAGCYAGVLHYLRAVAAMAPGSAKGSGAAVSAKGSGAAVIAEMKRMPTDDSLFGPGRIRADGRKIHDMHLFRVKAPARRTARGTCTTWFRQPPARRRSGRFRRARAPWSLHERSPSRNGTGDNERSDEQPALRKETSGMTAPTLTRRGLAAAGLAVTAGALARPAIAADAPLKVGLMLPFSGTYAALGDSIASAFELRLAETGGMMGGRAVQIVRLDDESDPAKAVQNVNRLLNRDKADVLVGTVHSGVVMALVQASRERGVPLIIPNAGNAAATGELCAPSIFRTSFTNWQPAYGMGRALAAQGVKRAAWVSWDYAAGREAGGGFADGLKAGGAELTKALYLPFPETNFQPILAQLAGLDVQATGAFFAGGGAVQFVRDYAAAGLRDRIPLSGSGFLTEGTLGAQGAAGEGIMTALHYGDGIDNPRNIAFRAAFREKARREADVYAVQGYDAAQLLAIGLDATKGDVEADKALFAAMGQARIDSPRGTFTLSPSHNPVQNIYLRQAKNRENVVVSIAVPMLADPGTGCKMPTA